MLTRRDALQHLLRLGLLSPGELVTQDIRATEYVGRNHLVRIERSNAPCYIVKQPRDANAPDAATMWTEAAVFWLSVHDPAFAVLAPWMPRYYHYDELNRLLTIELVAASDSLLAKQTSGLAIEPRLLHDVGRAFGTLHGPASQVLREERVRRLFNTGLAWVLTLGQPQSPYSPGTAAAQSIVASVLQRPDVVASTGAGARGLARCPYRARRCQGRQRADPRRRRGVRDRLGDCRTRRRSLGHRRHGAFAPRSQPGRTARTAGLRAGTHACADRRAVGRLCRGQRAAGAPRRSQACAVAAAGARIVQTCLENTQFTNQILSACAADAAHGARAVDPAADLARAMELRRIIPFDEQLRRRRLAVSFASPAQARVTGASGTQRDIAVTGERDAFGGLAIALYADHYSRLTADRTHRPPKTTQRSSRNCGRPTRFHYDIRTAGQLPASRGRRVRRHGGGQHRRLWRMAETVPACERDRAGPIRPAVVPRDFVYRPHGDFVIAGTAGFDPQTGRQIRFYWNLRADGAAQPS